MIEAFFHKCYYSYLDGNLENAKMYMDFLREEFRSTGNKDALNKYQLRHLKKVRDAIKEESIRESVWTEKLKEVPDSTPSKESIKKHQDIVKEIHKNAFTLKSILSSNIGEFLLENIEHPCPPYGRIDMLYRDDVYVYPVEVKPGRGDHDIVGQILKYDRFCRKNLHLRLWEDVKAVTVCKSYSNFAFQELKRRGIITVLFESIGNGIKLEKV